MQGQVPRRLRNNILDALLVALATLADVVNLGLQTDCLTGVNPVGTVLLTA